VVRSVFYGKLRLMWSPKVSIDPIKTLNKPARLNKSSKLTPRYLELHSNVSAPSFSDRDLRRSSLAATFDIGVPLSAISRSTESTKLLLRRRVQFLGQAVIACTLGRGEIWHASQRTLVLSTRWY
jgi:hypothetical protein